MQPRVPGRIREIVEIDIARPRSFQAREARARFIELRHHLLDLIFEHERAGRS